MSKGPKKCKCPIKGAGKERECFNSWWGPGNGRCTCPCHYAEEDLLAWAEAKRLRDEGMARVSSNNSPWFDRCVIEATLLAKENPEVNFTGEDIRLHCEPRIGSPKHRNAWGALINYLIKAGVIRPTGEHRPMRTKLSHARSTPVYTPHARRAA